jgi:hypothetical protein
MHTTTGSYGGSVMTVPVSATSIAPLAGYLATISFRTDARMRRTTRRRSRTSSPAGPHGRWSIGLPANSDRHVGGGLAVTDLCRLVDVEPRLHKDQVRASVLRRHGRHCRAHPERPGLVARGRDDATLARPADRNRFAAQLRIVATADFPDLFVANSCHAVFGLLLPSCLSELWAILSRRLGRRAFPGMDYPTPWKKFRQRHLKLSHRRARERDRHSAMNSCASSAKGFAGAGLVFGT